MEIRCKAKDNQIQSVSPEKLSNKDLKRDTSIALGRGNRQDVLGKLGAGVVERRVCGMRN